MRLYKLLLEARRLHRGYMQAEAGTERETEVLEAYHSVAQAVASELGGIIELATEAKLITISVFEPVADDQRWGEFKPDRATTLKDGVDIYVWLPNDVSGVSPKTPKFLKRYPATIENLRDDDFDAVDDEEETGEVM